MKKLQTAIALILIIGMVSAAQPQDLPPGLKDAVARDAACSKTGDAGGSEMVSAVPIRSAGREVGDIVFVQGPCHCQAANCDALVYLRQGEGFKLAIHEKYVSLHPMKIVKHGMPSLTGTWEISALKTETTVYDWDGKSYRPNLCATVIKGKRVPSITQHPCKPPSH